MLSAIDFPKYKCKLDTVVERHLLEPGQPHVLELFNRFLDALTNETTNPIGMVSTAWSDEEGTDRNHGELLYILSVIYPYTEIL